MSSAACANRLSPPPRQHAVEQPVGLLAPGVVAGQRGEPHQVLRGDRVRIGGGVVAGRGRPHHQALGVVGGEEIAAVRRIGVVRVEARAARPAPARDRRARRSPRRAPARRGSWRRSRRRARDTAAGPRARNGRAGRPWSCARAMKSKARAAIVDPGRLAEHGAGIDQRRDHQAVPVGQHLVVEAGPHPLAARTSSSLARSMASRASSSSLRGKLLSRLRILWPSKLPAVGHVVMLRKKRSILRAQHLDDLGLRPDVELALLAFRIGVERGARTRPPGVVISRASQPTVSRARCAEQRIAGALRRRAPAAREAGRCRRASSRNAAPASARRPSSARSRRRDDRRCRPRRCAPA